MTFTSKISIAFQNDIFDFFQKIEQKNENNIFLEEQDRFTTSIKTCGTGSGIFKIAKKGLA